MQTLLSSAAARKRAEVYDAKIHEIYNGMVIVAPGQLYKGSGCKDNELFTIEEQKLYFHCNECGHRWLANPKRLKNGFGCPHCRELARTDSEGVKRFPRATLQEKLQFAELRAEGMSQRAIALKLNKSTSTIAEWSTKSLDELFKK